MSQLSNNGDTVMFTCIAIAFPSPLYSWTTPIANSDFNTSTITITASHSSFGNYTCMATSNGTIVVSPPALLTGMPCDVCVLLMFLFSVHMYTHTYTHTKAGESYS